MNQLLLNFFVGLVTLNVYVQYFIHVIRLKKICVFFPRGTLKFSSVLEAGTSKRKAEIMDLQKRLQFDDPINIQFTSVSYLLFGRKKENLHLRYPTFRTLLGLLYFCGNSGLN